MQYYYTCRLHFCIVYGYVFIQALQCTNVVCLNLVRPRRLCHLWVACHRLNVSVLMFHKLLTKVCSPLLCWLFFLAFIYFFFKPFYLLSNFITSITTTEMSILKSDYRANIIMLWWWLNSKISQNNTNIVASVPIWLLRWTLFCLLLSFAFFYLLHFFLSLSLCAQISLQFFSLCLSCL